MLIHRSRLLTPFPPVVLEVANQFLFLAIHADHQYASRQTGQLQAFNVLELLIAIWMDCSAQAFFVGFQAVILFMQQAPDCCVAHLMPGFLQFLAQVTQTTPLLFPFAH